MRSEVYLAGASKDSNLKFMLVVIGLAVTWILGSSTVHGDIGSKHREQHKKSHNRNTEKYSTRPFDFSEIADTVGILQQGAIEQHLGVHVDQSALESLSTPDAFLQAFEQGDELFEINYNAIDGVGINVGNGQRFSSRPRPDLKGPMAWASVMPPRITGPNGASCISCHNLPVADGAGEVNDNVIRIDADRKQRGFIERQAPHIFGMGAVQLLAEEMTSELQGLRAAAISASCASGAMIELELQSKGVDFGTIHVSCENTSYHELQGIDQDLVVKPFEWKGLTAFVRDFVRGASHQELGMQAVELVGGSDSDFDGVADELSVGDITALSIYNAAQPRPVTKQELNPFASNLTQEELDRYGLPLDASQVESIENGKRLFGDAQCSSCHTAALTISSPVYYEPSNHPEFSDSVFPAGESVALPAVAIQFDITSDIPDNALTLESGQTLGQFERNIEGAAIVRLYGDLKRHDMGPALGEEIDEGYVGASVFLTENLWGVGSTAPYLHDGRATTLAEAILHHGGEAQTSRDLFASMSTTEQSDVIAFLDNLILYLAP